MVAFHYSVFRRGDDDGDECQAPRQHENAKELGIGITIHALFAWIAAACLLLTLISAVFLIWKHLHRYTVPKEQRQCVRVIALPPVFCALALLCVIFDKDAIYIQPLMGIYEAFCLAGLFLLLVEYVCPDEQARDKFFDSTPLRDRKKNIIPGGSLQWFNLTFAKVLQFPLMRVIIAVVEIGTEAGGVYCENSFSGGHAHLWVTIIDTISSGVAILGLIQFWQKFKRDMAPKHKVTAKVVSMKGIIALRVLQTIALGIANDHFTPTKTFTYNDMVYALPNFLIAVEALLFSCAYHYAFRSRHYHADERRRVEDAPVQRMPTVRAALHAMNVADIIEGVAIAVIRLVRAYFDKHRKRRGGPGAGIAMPPPKRQRTRELDEHAYEPYQGQAPQGNPNFPQSQPYAYNGNAYGLQEMGTYPMQPTYGNPDGGYTGVPQPQQQQQGYSRPPG